MNIFALIPRNINLSKKLTILMLTVFVGGLILSSVVYHNILLRNAQKEINSQANLIISTMDSVRKYTHDQVNPLLSKQSEEQFLLESIPDFSVRGVFDILTKTYQDKYGEYRYKSAMLNPTNMKNQATAEEGKIIENLSQQDTYKPPGENIEEGFLMINGKNFFYTARPIKITQSNCLRCHTSLEKSPKSLQVLYEQAKIGANQGFGWELNKVIGTKIVYVPTEQVNKIAHEHFISILAIFTTIFGVTIFLVTLWLKKYVVQPLNKITKVAEAVSLGDMDAEFEKHSNDEIGHLADAFTRLKTSLRIAMRRLTQRGNSHQNESS